MNTLAQDLRFVSRSLWKRPAFTGAAIITFALDIGANTAILSIVNSVLLRPVTRLTSRVEPRTSVC